MMDILFQLSDLLFQDTEELINKDLEYRNLKRTEGRLMEQLPVELQGKLLEVQMELGYHDLLRCFLQGIRVGIAASELGQGS